MTTTSEQNGTKQSAVFPRACALALSALVAVGCGAEASDELGSETLASDVPCVDEGEPPAGDGGVEPDGKDTPNPEGSYYASVTANGTGCPKGTWTTEIAKDGGKFTTKLSAYVAEVNESKAVDVKDCQFAVKLHSPQGLSFRLKRLGFEGAAFLEEGVQARLTARYYFQGNPVSAEQVREDLTGPFDDTFVFEDGAADAPDGWSPCGVDRDLNIYTSVRVQNTSPRKNGKVKIENLLDGVLEWRACDAGTKAPEAGEPEHTAPEIDEDDAEVESKPDAGAGKPRGPRGWWGGRHR